MRICFVLSQFPETHETFILRELVALDRAGIDFFILSLKKCKDRVVHPEARAFLTRTHYFDRTALGAVRREFLDGPFRAVAGLVRSSALCARSSSPARTILAWPFSLWCARMARRLEATALHAHWATMPTTVAMEASALAGLPFSFTAHAWDIFAGDDLLALKLGRAAFAITCTAYNSRVLERLSPSRGARIHLAYHGLECAQLDVKRVGGEKGLLRVLSIGRLVEQKGFEFLIDALRIFKEGGRRAKTVIVGDGPLREKLARQVSRHGLTRDITFAGTVSFEQIKEYFRRSDLFVLPCVVAQNNDRDGLPNVILEAMAAGLPVVSTGVSGIPEAVDDDVTGLLVPDRDAKALADALVRLADDPALRRKLGRAGKRAVAEKFDLERTSAKLIEIFRQGYGL